MYSTQNNNSATIQTINEEDTETEVFGVCTETFGNGRIRYHYYSDGVVYKEIRSPFEETVIYEMTLEEINADEIASETRARVLAAANKYKQTGEKSDFYKSLWNDNM